MQCSCRAEEAEHALAEANQGRPRWGRRGMTTPATDPADRQRVDTRLMQRVAAGDRDALGELYDRFSGPLYGTAWRILREPAEAQDVVQDAFVAIWEKAASYEATRGSVFSWALTLVRNRAIDRLRLTRRRAELLAGSVGADGEAMSSAPGPSGREAAVAQDDASAVRQAVAVLAPEQQRALELAFFGGLTQEQIAEELGEPLGTVKARIRRGLLKLRETLGAR